MNLLCQNRAENAGTFMPLRMLVTWVLLAAGSLCVAYEWPRFSGLMVVYLFSLVQLARAETWRKAAYGGLVVGLVVAATELSFFYRIFSGGALALWLVWAFWLGLFTALARLSLRRLGPTLGWLMIPFLWVGLEFFRSELYFLRFSWVNAGYAFAATPGLIPIHYQGVYGAGFVLMFIACGAAFLWDRARLPSLAALATSAVAIVLCGVVPGTSTDRPSRAPARQIRIAGIQLEFPTETEVLLRLNELVRKHPETELVVLSEYTFTEAIPARIKDWCRKNQRYLIVGGEDPTSSRNFYNTAFVIGPEGEIVFRQVKAVPIQFFKDGLPAPQQELWDSPWGKIGICICYDLSYARVTDRLVRQGARALIVPTMDVADWGQRQHGLHGRIAPIRAAEYGIPVFRLASSGISQFVDGTGRVVANAPTPGDAAILRGTLELRGPGTLPSDRWLAPLALGVTVLVALLALVRSKTGETTSGEVQAPRLERETRTPKGRRVWGKPLRAGLFSSKPFIDGLSDLCRGVLACRRSHWPHSPDPLHFGLRSGHWLTTFHSKS